MSSVINIEGYGKLPFTYFKEASKKYFFQVAAQCTDIENGCSMQTRDNETKEILLSMEGV